MTPQAVVQSGSPCTATASGDHTGTCHSNLLGAEEEPHLISSLQLGVKLAEDLLQLFPDHVGENIQASPAKGRPLVATSSASLASSANDALPLARPITQRQRNNPTDEGSPREGALNEETTSPGRDQPRPPPNSRPRAGSPGPALRSQLRQLEPPPSAGEFTRELKLKPPR